MGAAEAVDGPLRRSRRRVGGPDPGGDGGDLRVGEVPEEAGRPPGRDGAVAVEERHQPGGHLGQGVVAGGGRATVDRAHHEPRSVPGAHRGDGVRVRRTVVDDDHRDARPHGGEAAVECIGPVPHRHHHRDGREVRRSAAGPRRGGPGVGHARTDQSTGQVGGGAVARPPCDEGVECRRAGCGQGHHPPGMAPGEHGARPEPSQRPVESEPEPGRERAHQLTG